MGRKERPIHSPRPPSRRGRRHAQAHLSTQGTASQASAWFPGPHAHQGRAEGSQGPSPQGAMATDRVRDGPLEEVPPAEASRLRAGVQGGAVLEPSPSDIAGPSQRPGTQPLRLRGQQAIGEGGGAQSGSTPHAGGHPIASGEDSPRLGCGAYRQGALAEGGLPPHRGSPGTAPQESAPVARGRPQ